MKLQIPYTEAKAKFPSEMELIMERLRKSSSINKHWGETELAWEYNWGQRLQGLSFQDVVAGKREKTFPELHSYADRDNVRTFLGDSINWSITGRAGKWCSHSLAQEGNIPLEILDLYVKMYTDQIAEQKRIAGLTPEEKQAEVEATLKALRRSPGFVELNLSK